MQLWMCQCEQQVEMDTQDGVRRETYIQQFRARSEREAYLWRMIQENWVGFYQHELDWVRRLRQGLAELDHGKVAGSR